MSEVDWKPKAYPWDAPEYDPQVVYAIRALRQGEALPHQQKLAWNWLMYVTGAGDGFSDLSFRPDSHGGERATCMAEGKKFVGLQMLKLFRPEVTDWVRAEAASAAVKKK